MSVNPDDYCRCRLCKLNANDCQCHKFYDDEAANEEADREREMRQEVDAINARQTYRD